MRARTLVVYCLVIPLVCTAPVVRGLALLPPIRNGLRKLKLLYYAKCEVARFEGIILSNITGHDSTDFCRIILGSLELLKATDPIRFSRVRRHLSWIVCRTRLDPVGAHYEHGTRACAIFFMPPRDGYPEEYLIGSYACTLVHEATHGFIECRGISYDRERRERIERICCEEAQRFVDRLSHNQPTLAEQLRDEFDPADWDWNWNATRLDRLRALLGQIERMLFLEK